MDSLLLFPVTGAEFNPADFESALSSIEGVRAVRREPDGAIEAEYHYGSERIVARLSGSREYAGIRGAGDTALRFCWELGARMPGLRLVNQAYSFDVELDELADFDDLVRATES